ncbi:MAG: ATP phosphoribosyltransferase [Hyphomonadaceae bacterium]
MSALTIAIPSKGRLKEQSEAYFAESGYQIEQDGGERGYRAKFAGKSDISILLLPAREIAQGLIDGAFHAGITGEDLLHELSEVPGKNAVVIRRLGFGGADVVVAVPNCWLDVSTLTDLDAAGALFRQTHGRRLRVATKYLRITRRCFADAAFGEYRLVYSAGATEAAPASGTADLIVDITSTGATLLANNLKILDDGVMLKSEASFTVARKADWSEAARQALGGLRTSLSLSIEEASVLDGFMKKL